MTMKYKNLIKYSVLFMIISLVISLNIGTEEIYADDFSCFCLGHEIVGGGMIVHFTEIMATINGDEVDSGIIVKPSDQVSVKYGLKITNITAFVSSYSSIYLQFPFFFVFSFYIPIVFLVYFFYNFSHIQFVFFSDGFFFPFCG